MGLSRSRGSRFFSPICSLAAACGVVFAARGAWGQANFAEDFENIGVSSPAGPQNLVNAGWIFRNQSSQTTTFPAWSAIPGGGWANSGSGFLRGSSAAVDGFVGQQMSHWVILPPTPNMRAGDVFSVWVLDGAHGSLDTYLDIRYSPTGGTSTGSGPGAVGDFTQVLFTGELPISIGPFVYTLASAPIPGSGPATGRIAVRFHAPNMHSVGGVTANLYLDTLTIGPAQGPPCALEMPGPGETVTWPARPAPYVICQDLIVPATATLVLGPGARVEVEPGRDLFIEGALLAEGTAAAPVVIVGNNVSGLSIDGRVELRHTDVSAGVYVYRDASVEASDTIFREDGWLSSMEPRTFVRLQRCEIRCELASFGRTTIFDQVSITNPQSLTSINGFWRIASLESVAPLTFIAAMQDRLVDNVTVTGVTSAPAIELHGTGGVVDFQLGAGNMLTGNQYPVWPRFTGLTPDSSVPVSGNINNAIRGAENAGAALRSRVSIPNFGIPYHFLERGSVRGNVMIAPGSVLQFGPAGGLTISGDNGTDGTLRGLPGQPIVLERLDPTREWFSLATGPGWQIFEHLDISGAGVGVVGNEAELWLRDSVIHDCTQGAHPSADGNIYGTGVEFYNNELALRDDVSNPAAQTKTGIHFSGVERPNIFVGNTIAARNFGTTNGNHHPFPVDNNWWGHTTGPHEPLFHPQGQGDEIAPFVEFQPFLTQRPDLSDARPVVRLKTRVHPAVVPGEQFIVEWDAFDDGAITSFDVIMLDPNYDLPPGFHFITLGENLPGTQRSFEIHVPDVGLHPYERFPFRIVARDDAGNSSFEQFWVSIPHQAPSAQVAFHTVLTEFRGGEDIEICYDAMNLNTSPRFYIETAADDRVSMSAAGHAGLNQCTLSAVRMPYASTDRARLAIRAEGNWNRDEWYFTDYFTIRPDPRIGDEPPQVQLVSPLDGEAFAGGGMIPIRWSATDDRSLREFRLQASFNGGYTFHTIEASIPPSARALDWRLPASTGIPDVRLRIVAVDSMMQNSSSGDDRVISIAPGAPVPPCSPDFDNDGDAGTDADIEAFFACLAGACCPTCGTADFDGDGDTGTDADIEAFFRVLGGGAC